MDHLDNLAEGQDPMQDHDYAELFEAWRLNSEARGCAVPVPPRPGGGTDNFLRLAVGQIRSAREEFLRS